MTLTGFGKDPANPSRVRSDHWTSDRNQATSASDTIDIEYINDKGGLRQNFLVRQRPPGNQPLELGFLVQANGLDFEVDSIQNSVNFTGADGEAIVRYNDLHVFDATGAELPAVMLRTDANHFAIVVDDSDAAYPILVDPFWSSVKVYFPAPSGSKFGFSLAMYSYEANSADYPGIVVGAPYFDNGSGPDVGKVYVYYGNPLPNSPSQVIEGNQSYAHFGWSVADAGDHDGNGFGDILVGSPDWDENPYTDCGKAWLFNGSSSGVGYTASWTYTIPYYSSQLGYAVSGVGDMNGDDIADFAIGAPGYSNGSAGDGGVFVFKGSGSGPSYLTTIGGDSLSQLGFSLSRAGDIDADGADDFIAGAPSYNPGSGARGAVKVYFSNGSSSYSASTIGVGSSGDKFGFSVAGIGDLDADGYMDILVGAPYFDNGQTDEGKAYIFKGTSTGINSSASWSVESNQASAHYGWSAAGRVDWNDVDLDGYADFMVGAPDWDHSSYTNPGGAFVYSGGGGSPSQSTVVVTTASNNHTGYSVALGPVIYRTPGIAVGTPDDSGGAVQLLQWVQ